MKATAANYIKLDRHFGVDSTDEQARHLLSLYDAMPRSEKSKLESIWFAQQEEYDREEEEQYRREMISEAHFHAYPQ
jgi:hypothetical protein